MRQYHLLTPAELARAEERLRHPPPGSRMEAARQFGIDLTLLIEQLRLTPAERVRRMHDVCQAAEDARGAARGKCLGSGTLRNGTIFTRSIVHRQ